MKKLVRMSILLMFVFLLVGCKEQSEDARMSSELNVIEQEELVDTYAEQIQLFTEQKDVWILKDAGPGIISVAIYDLDGDGILELMTTVIQGTGLYAYNNFYQADLENECIVELEQGPEELLEYEGLGLELASYGYERRDKAYVDENGRILYPAVDYGRAGMAFSSCTEGVYYLEDGVVMNQVIRSYTTDFTENEDGIETYYVAGGLEPVTKEEWEAEYEKFVAKKEQKEINIGWKELSEDEMSALSIEEWSEILTSSWQEAMCE